MIDQFRCRFFVVAAVALQYAEIDRELAALQCWLVLFFFASFRGAACPKLHAGTAARWSVLAGALGLQ